MKLYIDFTPKPGALVSRILELPDDAPHPGAPFEERTRAEFAAWQAAQPAGPARQDTGTVLRRLTNAERAALHAARSASWHIDYFVALAYSEGVIDSADPDFDAAVAALDGAGIIASDRWTTLLAP